jgi:hydroxymethylbilane synthase
MGNAMNRLRIATRESRLAMRQTEMISEAIRGAHAAIEIEIVGMSTRGDRVLDRPLAEVGGKGLFVKELEIALEEDRADIAVHSMKDVPMRIPGHFALATFGPREDPADAFVSNNHASLAAMPPGSRVGTSSLRRESQLRALHPRLDFVPLRGNVNTRLAKLDAGEYGAIILAAAGLKRLGFAQRIRARLVETIPAICQGILAVEYRRDRPDVAALIAGFEDAATSCAARAERALGLVVEGSCEIPLGALARVTGPELSLEAFIGLPDGTRGVREETSGRCDDAEKIGALLADRLLAAGGREILKSLARVKA